MSHDDSESSATRPIAQLAAGGPGEAARGLRDRYLHRRVRAARARHLGTRRGVADGEDIALGTFGSLGRGIAERRLRDRDGGGPGRSRLMRPRRGAAP